MTQIDDAFYNGAGLPISSVSPGGLQKGALCTPAFCFIVTPAQSTTTSLGAAQTLSGTSAVPAAATLLAGPGITVTTFTSGLFQGQTFYKFDTPRAVLMTGISASTAAVTATILGVDWYNQPQTCTFTGPAGATSVSSLKTFSAVSGITVSGNTASGVSFGQADVLGLPYYVSNFGAIYGVFNSVTLTAASHASGDTTSPATALTSDVRGRLLLPSASDSVKRLYCWLTIEVPNTTAGLYGVTPA